MNISSLDVGCGVRHRATVKLDVARTKATNILGSAYYLPFRNKVFKTVFCYHVLEHLTNPKQALKELCRVGTQIKLKVPLLFYHHKTKFNFRCLRLKWHYGLDRERRRFGVSFRVELSASFKSAQL